jgi:hypothetical protein
MTASPALAAWPADTLAGVDMTDTLNVAWEAIRHQEPDVPRVQVSIVPGRGSSHWRPDPRVLHVAERTVDAGSLEILGFLLHHAAHDLATVAYADRYHGEEYRKAAERLRLDVAEVKGHGWIKTTVTPKLAAVYAPQLRQLEAARGDWEAMTRGDRKVYNRNGITARCQCHPEFKISIRGKDAAEKLAAHPVICSQCGQPFLPVERAEGHAEAR